MHSIKRLFFFNVRGYILKLAENLNKNSRQNQKPKQLKRILESILGLGDDDLMFMFIEKLPKHQIIQSEDKTFIN